MQCSKGPEVVRDLPKVARRSNEGKACGYLNAAKEGLRSALYFVSTDDPAHQDIEDLMVRVEAVQASFLASRP